MRLSHFAYSHLHLHAPNYNQGKKAEGKAASFEMEKAAVQQDGLLIPLIDFSKFQNGSEIEKLETAKAILKGFQTAGFIYLKNIPITSSTRAHVFGTSAKLFRLEEEEKMSYAWTTPQANRGYSEPGREKVSLLTDVNEVEKVRAAAPDIKESFEIGREDEPGHPNHWPVERGELVGFKSTMLDFFEQCKALHVEVVSTRSERSLAVLSLFFVSRKARGSPSSSDRKS